MDIALSDSDVMALIGGKAKLVLYPDITSYHSIDDILGPYGSCLLLFETKPKYGHWCCLTKRKNEIEFFNPYGGFPDDSLEYIPLAFRKTSNQLKPYLSMLLMDSPYQLTYNEHPYQREAKNVKTCGRHCAVRITYKDLPLEGYNLMMGHLVEKTLLDPDGVVVELTQ